MQEIVERIEKIMEDLKLSSSEFADNLGVGRPLLSHVLSGRNNPSLQLVMKIIEHYPMYSADWLIFGNEQNQSLLSNNKSEAMISADQVVEQNSQANIEAKPTRKLQNASADQIIMLYADLTFECYKLRK